MPTHNHWKPKYCRHCGAKISLLKYDGTGRFLPFDPIEVDRTDDPDARRYVMYTNPDTGEDRARLVTAEEPWDEREERRIRQHFLTCTKHPKKPPTPANPASSTATHRLSA